MDGLDCVPLVHFFIYKKKLVIVKSFFSYVLACFNGTYLVLLLRGYCCKCANIDLLLAFFVDNVIMHQHTANQDTTEA